MNELKNNNVLISIKHLSAPDVSLRFFTRNVSTSKFPLKKTKYYEIRLVYLLSNEIINNNLEINPN